MAEMLHPVRLAPLDASPGAGSPEPSEPSPTMALARAAAGGDEHATQRLLQQLGPRIARVVGVVLGFGHAEVDDVTQLALIAFTQALRAFRGECEPGHYASRIAARTAVNAQRRLRAARARYDDLADVELQTNSTTPHDDAIAERRKNAVRELLAVLPPEQAEALALRVALGWSLEEIAAASSTPLNTVRSRLRLAKEALRRKIESDPVLSDELEVRP